MEGLTRVGCKLPTSSSSIKSGEVMGIELWNAGRRGLLKQLTAITVPNLDFIKSFPTRSVRLNLRYSVYLLPFWIRRDIINKSKAHEMLDQLIKTGYHLKSTR